MVRLLSYTDDLSLSQRRFFVRWVAALPYLMRTHLYDYPHGLDNPFGGLLPAEVRAL